MNGNGPPTTQTRCFPHASLATRPQLSHHLSLPMCHPSTALAPPTFTLALHVHSPVMSMGTVISLGHHRKPDVPFTVAHLSTASRKLFSLLAMSSLSTSSPRALLSTTSRSLQSPRTHSASYCNEHARFSTIRLLVHVRATLR